MLHLTLVGGDVACASHELIGHAMPGMTRTSHASATARSMATFAAPNRYAAAQPAKDCTTPTQSACCDAMGNCSVRTTVSAVERPVSERLLAVGTPRLPSVVLESVLMAPDPPPPKG
jgi:hypothetical protein